MCEHVLAVGVRSDDQDSTRELIRYSAYRRAQSEPQTNIDGVSGVDVSDLLMLLSNFNTKARQPGYSSSMDFDNSGTIDADDFTVLNAQLGHSGAATAPPLPIAWRCSTIKLVYSLAACRHQLCPPFEQAVASDSPSYIDL